MAPDLYQLVDLTVTEADGITPFVEVDDEGRHILPLFVSDAACEVCPSEAEIVQDNDGHTVKTSETYTIAARGSPALCRRHLTDEPYHIGFTNPDEGGDP